MDKKLIQLIGKVRATQKRMIALLETKTADQDWKPDPGEWSFGEVAAHLATVDKECYQDRVVRIASGENPHFESYFNTGRDFSQYDIKDSIDKWLDTRTEIIEYVEALPKGKLSYTGTHEAFGTLTVPDVLELMREHDQEHIEELEKMNDKHNSET